MFSEKPWGLREAGSDSGVNLLKLGGVRCALGISQVELKGVQRVRGHSASGDRQEDCDPGGSPHSHVLRQGYHIIANLSLELIGRPNRGLLNLVEATLVCDHYCRFR